MPDFPIGKRLGLETLYDSGMKILTHLFLQRIMKRKLNEADVPIEVEQDSVNGTVSSFSSLGLDARLCQAVAKQNFSKPTSVQQEAIPWALKGRDILGTT